jgi:hypothetical protein
VTRRDWLKRIIAVPLAAAAGARLAQTVARDEQTGIAIKYIQSYDIAWDRLPHRIDVWLATSEPGMQRWYGQVVDWALVNGLAIEETISLAEYRKRFT